MGASRGNFTKYPRTPHLFGSTGTSDDKHLGEQESLRILSDESLIVEEKLDGANVGIHFAEPDELILQCRGHEITEGMHPQFDLFKQWSAVKQHDLWQILSNRFILFGEWLYARHTIHYRQLDHYFYEFDIYDKQTSSFLDLEQRLGMLAGAGIQTVPVIHTGSISRRDLFELIGPSAFDSQFENPQTGRQDNRMEGLYLRTEAGGVVNARAKVVRAEFIEKIKQSSHWKEQPLTPNLLAGGVSIWD